MCLSEHKDEGNCLKLFVLCAHDCLCVNDSMMLFCAFSFQTTITQQLERHINGVITSHHLETSQNNTKS